MSPKKFYGLINKESAEDYSKLEASLMEVSNKFIMYISDQEKKLIKAVLTELFKREPTEDEYNSIERLHEDGKLNQYKIRLKGIVIGTIIHKYSNPNNIHECNKMIGIEFQPDEMFKA